MALLRPFELLSFLRSDVLNSLPRQRLAQAFPGLLPRRRRNLKRQMFAAAQDLDFVLLSSLHLAQRVRIIVDVPSCVPVQKKSTGTRLVWNEE